MLPISSPVLKNPGDSTDQIPARANLMKNVMLFLHGNTFVSSAELFLAFGFEQGRASLNSSLRKQPGTNQKKNQLKKKSISPTA